MRSLLFAHGKRNWNLHGKCAATKLGGYAWQSKAGDLPQRVLVELFVSAGGCDRDFFKFAIGIDAQQHLRGSACTFCASPRWILGIRPHFLAELASDVAHETRKRFVLIGLGPLRRR